MVIKGTFSLKMYSQNILKNMRKNMPYAGWELCSAERQITQSLCQNDNKLTCICCNTDSENKEPDVCLFVAEVVHPGYFMMNLKEGSILVPTYFVPYERESVNLLSITLFRHHERQ